MSQNVREINDAQFAQAVSQGVALVDFWAPWCGPCRQQGPILEEVAAAVGEQAALFKVNVDESPDAAAAFRIRSIPTLLLFKDGQIVRTLVGVQQARALVEAIEQVLGTKQGQREAK